jgi:hypothetical protein
MGASACLGFAKYRISCSPILSLNEVHYCFPLWNDPTPRNYENPAPGFTSLLLAN